MKKSNKSTSTNSYSKKVEKEVFNKSKSEPSDSSIDYNLKASSFEGRNITTE